MKTILLLAMLFSFADPIPTIVKGTVTIMDSIGQAEKQHQEKHFTQIV
jgi:hypothetical protein